MGSHSTGDKVFLLSYTSILFGMKHYILSYRHNYMEQNTTTSMKMIVSKYRGVHHGHSEIHDCALYSIS